ncbi:hypothetical protein BOX15_Mlig018630g1, partial [Macrostomum lignano]
ATSAMKLRTIGPIATCILLLTGTHGSSGNSNTTKCSSVGSAVANCYCSRGSRVVEISPHDAIVEISTRYNDSNQPLPSGTNCKFVIPGRAHLRYLITVLEAHVADDATYLEVTDGNRTLLHDVNLHFSRRMAISSGGSISVNFWMGWNRRPGSGGGGYRIRMERFRSHHCPPNWTKAAWSAEQKFCISPSSADFLGLVANATAVADYVTAQDICNRMRANLLMPPKSQLKSRLGDLQKLLNYKDLVWIGLMSNSSAAPGKNLYWLDNSQEQPQQDPDFLTCRSGYTWSAGSACQSGELFGLLRPTPSAYLLLDRPNEQHYFACSAPIGGTDDFYPVWHEQSLFKVQGDPASKSSGSEFKQFFSDNFSIIVSALMLALVVMVSFGLAMIYRPRIHSGIPTGEPVRPVQHPPEEVPLIDNEEVENLADEELSINNESAGNVIDANQIVDIHNTVSDHTCAIQ